MARTGAPSARGIAKEGRKTGRLREADPNVSNFLLSRSRAPAKYDDWDRQQYPPDRWRQYRCPRPKCPHLSTKKAKACPERGILRNRTADETFCPTGEKQDKCRLWQQFCIRRKQGGGNLPACGDAGAVYHQGLLKKLTGRQGIQRRSVRQQVKRCIHMGAGVGKKCSSVSQNPFCFSVAAGKRDGASHSRDKREFRDGAHGLSQRHA